jgi:hypothetical protein
MKFIKISWKSIEDANSLALSDSKGKYRPSVANITDETNESTMIPIVGGHLISL